MNAEVSDLIKQCSICNEFQVKNQKLPMQSHELPDHPWSQVAADQFKLHGKEYIVLVDYYSDFLEVQKLEENTSSSVIEFFKEQFSRHDIPDTLTTDNASQFTSHEFQYQFSVDWEFTHVSSSPHHPKSNGKAESAVKVVKSLFRKALKDNKDPWLALMDQRNTPTEFMESSPAQRLMSRCTRTLLPTASNLLLPKIPESVNAKLKLKRQKAKWYHDRTSRYLPELHVGQEVKVAPLKKNQIWKSGTCIEKLSDRSYVVKTSSDNQVFHRNREFLKPATRPAEQPKPVESCESPITKSVNQPSKQDVKSANLDPKPTMTSQSVPLKKTRTRVVKPPSRFNDFVA